MNKLKLLLILIPFLSFSQFRTDLALHFIAGAGISATTYHYMYKWTGKKWISRTTGVLLASGIGLGKEYIYDASGRGIVSKQDALYTIYGALVIQIPIGHKKKKK